jgi:hypothetical protein
MVATGKRNRIPLWEFATSEIKSFRLPDFGLPGDGKRLETAPDAQANLADITKDGAASRPTKDFR